MARVSTPGAWSAWVEVSPVGMRRAGGAVVRAFPMVEPTRRRVGGSGRRPARVTVRPRLEGVLHGASGRGMLDRGGRGNRRCGIGRAGVVRIRTSVQMVVACRGQR
jgi:hypothetical protein